MTEDRDFRNRQRTLIRARISAYLDGKLTLNELANDLEALAIAVTNFNSDWHARYQKAWAALEEVNAVMLDEHRREPDAEDRPILESSLHKLMELADELVGS